jgi:hypothetical protein
VRIESAASASARLTPVQREQAVSAILWMTNRPDTVGAQIDFDARSSERAFYGDLRRGQDFTDPACRLSAGVSTDEPLPRLHYGRRIYIFHPRSWTAASAANILREVRSRR